ncbi:MAG: hypothetical protein ACR2G5_13780 [Pyrinomonadaceae bacterium]
MTDFTNDRDGVDAPQDQFDPVSGLPFLYDPTAFANPTLGTFGNSGRAVFRLPGRNQTNLSLTKNWVKFHSFAISLGSFTCTARSVQSIPVLGPQGTCCTLKI